jgi:hypothetical protein
VPTETDFPLGSRFFCPFPSTATVPAPKMLTPPIALLSPMRVILGLPLTKRNLVSEEFTVKVPIPSKLPTSIGPPVKVIGLAAPEITDA